MRNSLMKIRPSKRLLLILVPILLLACGLTEQATEAPVPFETSAGTPAIPETAESDETPTSSIPLEQATPTSAAVDQAPARNPLLSFPGVIELENLVPVSGVGIRPLLEWQMVDGASYYNIVVFEPDGTPYWAWRTDNTSVYVAGIDAPLPEEKEGPVIADGMTWQVTAFDGDQVPIAAGGPWSISP